jgi:hypothetical protein
MARENIYFTYPFALNGMEKMMEEEEIRSWCAGKPQEVKEQESLATTR